MQKMLLEAQELQEELVSYRRTIHQNPELGMDLPVTAAFVKEKLEEMGYEASYIAGCGVTALAGGKKEGKVILLRADMDALPVAEETDVEFKSENGKMHACGHDMHTTMLLGAAKLLKAHEDELEGTVKFMFQPGEETLEGAKAMVEAGILENPKVDAAIMFHVAGGYPFPAGMMVVPGGGAFTAASDWFEINITGKGGHGAMPENSVDPLVVASQIHIALQMIKAREIASSENAVMTIGQIAGGTTNNVIPDTAHMKGTIRTFSKETRDFIPERIETIAKGVATGFRAEAELVMSHGCPSVVVDPKMSADVREIMISTFGERAVPDIKKLGFDKMSGSEDFSYISEKVPSVMLAISAGNSLEGYQYPVHHPKAKFDESILSTGAAAYASIAYGWLKKNK